MNRFVLAIVALCFFSSVCNGGFFLSFSADGSVTNYNVAVGGVVDIPVYLRETVTNNLATRGMEFIGVRVNFSNGSGDATLVQAPVINPLFSDFKIEQSSPTFSIVSGGVPLGATIPKNSPLLLGTFRFQGNLLNNITTIRLADPDRFGAGFNGDNLLAGPGEELDTSINFSETVTITAVPEPSTLILVGVAATSMGAVAWRRRKMKSAQMNG
jgi:hypothetical protein